MMFGLECGFDATEARIGAALSATIVANAKR